MTNPVQRPSLFWFRRDLRLEGNPALAQAAALGAPLALVFVADPDDLPGGAGLWWRDLSLARLQADLARRGQCLHLVEGSPLDCIPRLATSLRAEHVFWNKLHEPKALALEADLKRLLDSVGINVTQAESALLFPPGSVLNKSGQPFRVFTPFWKTCRPRLKPGKSFPLPARFPPAAPLTGYAPYRLAVEADWAKGFALFWTPGEDGAQQRLKDFISDKLSDYATLRDRPDIDGTSRLSPHLHWGEIGPAQILTAIETARSKRNLNEGGIEKFLSELGWREFAHHLLDQFPQLGSLEFKTDFRSHPWKSDPEALRAWQQGRTGFPIVDAGMRQLWATGWMHNRVRMIAASFMVKQLQIDWRLGLDWFNDTLLDADLANNAAGWQWVAGTGADAAPYFRIFNPILQGRKFDPKGDYVRRWVPEIAHLDAESIHDPWQRPDESIRHYPPPLVDLAKARTNALAARKHRPTC